MAKNYVLMGVAVVVAIALFASTTVISMASAQGANMTAGGGDIIKKLISAAVKAKALKTVINNKDVFVVVCDPDTTDPGTQCKVFNIQPTEQ